MLFTTFCIIYHNIFLQFSEVITGFFLFVFFFNTEESNASQFFLVFVQKVEQNTRVDNIDVLILFSNWWFRFHWIGKESVLIMLCITSSGISAHPKGAQLVIFAV